MRKFRVALAAAIVATGMSAGLATQSVGAAPAPAKVAAVAAQPVTPGAFCSPGGAIGKSKTGLTLKCTTTAADSRNRWRVK